MDTGGNKSSNSSTPYFHSVHLDKTKASEKKEYFTNVKEESKLKKNLEKNLEKGKKTFSKETIDKVKSEAKKINFKKLFIKIGISLGALLFISFAIFLIIKYSPTDKTQAEADSFLVSEPETGITIYDKLIFHAKSKEEKASLYLSRAKTLSAFHSEEYSSQIIKDAYAAESLVKTKTTALTISLYESLYGSKSKAEEWTGVAETREYTKNEVKDEENYE